MFRQVLIAIIFSVAACAEKNSVIENPEHYDLCKPEKFILPSVLNEISGIAISDNDTIYAEQDEEGRLFYFKFGDKNFSSVKFGRKGDYEDVSICNNDVFMLRSDGTIFNFPLHDALNNDKVDSREWKGLLPEGEFESMYADQKNSKLYIVCKSCSEDKQDKQVSGFILSVEGGNITPAGNFSLNVKQIEKLSGVKKIKFRPSAIIKNPVSNDWFIISSVNQLLVIADETWKVKQVVKLNPAEFNQPEGIAFDKHNNLYISNEGSKIAPANILKFNYHR